MFYKCKKNNKNLTAFLRYELSSDDVMTKCKRKENHN